ncbi:RNA-binding protein 43-like isoform X2 [Mobula hypostoma]|uniref:RNA-binding protein 43-like isoform X2 n=1 Tax=Mobula hypostoma TaxID=723540 RepID=UPI002FC2D14D
MERREATPGAGCSTWQPEMEIPCPKKIQVLNVPTIFPEQKTVNKLTMHFQKRTNGGGEVLDVKYPTSVEGCAFVMFVKEEDANNVLKHEQKLMIDKEEYTLKVIEFVIAKLDTGRFPTGMVHNLIRKHKFEIVSYHGSVAKIKGTFSSLKELREILMKYYEYLQTVTPVTDSGQSTDSREL